MKIWHNLFLLPVTGVAVCMLIGDVYAATSTGRDAYDNVMPGRAGVTTASSSQRMPTMPTMPNFTVGNTTMDLPSVSPEKPNNPDDGDDDDDGDDGDDDGDDDNPVEPDCPDGGVENSDYTIENCMDDIRLCIDTGALPGGLNDLFNEDLRESIVNGVSICAPQVERCIKEVRKDCSYVYQTWADVWIDFNSRRVQPEYYNFVLRKTGLTPNQAETTCNLLDVNTYGTSFEAVSNAGGVTAEYNIGVGAYNEQGGGILVKRNPQGPELNYGNSGVDGQRGHYARWDPTTAECLVRVAAYNKDQQIKNSWLFGAAGNDEPAEVWRKAGDTFTCNRDLFGFSLMNQTNTAAVVGIGGGALVGAGVGAIAGHGDRAFDCGIQRHRKLLTDLLKSEEKIGEINTFIDSSSLKISQTSDVISEQQCNQVVNLYDLLTWSLEIYKAEEKRFSFILSLDCEDSDIENCIQDNATACYKREYTTVDECEKYINDIVYTCKSSDANTCKTEFATKYGIEEELLTAEEQSSISSYSSNFSGKIPNAFTKCFEDGNSNECSKQVTQGLSDAFTEDIRSLLQNGDSSNMGKAIGIGAGVGAGAGGLATAITAFVERSNISCHVGDGLAQVGYNKSYSIESLKDFYIKWGLKVPETITPAGTVTDCASWRRTCNSVTNLEQCALTQINYRPQDADTTMLILGACSVSGGVCIENYPVAKSHGACE